MVVDNDYRSLCVSDSSCQTVKLLDRVCVKQHDDFGLFDVRLNLNVDGQMLKQMLR